MQRAIASGSTDDGSHNHDHRFYGADVTLKARVQLDNANAPLTLDATSVTFANGSDLYTFPTSDGSDGQILTTNGFGTLSFEEVELVNDQSPQLGNNLDLNGNYIYNSASGNIVIIDPTNAATNAKVQIEDNGSGSGRITFVGDSTDLAGGTIEARDETFARANFSFIAKQLDLTADGGDLRLKTDDNHAVVIHPNVTGSATHNISFTSTGLGQIDMDVATNFSINQGSRQLNWEGGDPGINTNVPFTFANYNSTQIAALTPAPGMVVYNTTGNVLQCWNGSSWNNLF